MIDRTAVKARFATVLVCVLDVVLWAAAAWATFASGSDQATKGLDRAAGLAVTALFLLTGAPAIALTLARRAPIAALVLALAFPGMLVAAFVAAIVAFS